MFDDQGRVVHRRGVTDSPGLYFLGLPWQHTRGSALLGWVKPDAAHLSERIRDGAPVAATASRPLADTPPVTPNRIGELA